MLVDTQKMKLSFVMAVSVSLLPMIRKVCRSKCDKGDSAPAPPPMIKDLFPL